MASRPTAVFEFFFWIDGGLYLNYEGHPFHLNKAIGHSDKVDGDKGFRKEGTLRDFADSS